jgi:hypothetical protein
VLAERLQGVRGDVRELGEEQHRMRERLHKLEGLTQMLVDAQQANRQAEANQYRRLELRLQLLTVAVTLAAVAVPIVVAILSGK